jgi:hypothetical protein
LFGQSIFIIGQGRSGKTGLVLDFINNRGVCPPLPIVSREDRKKWIIIAPSRTHPAFYGLDYITDSEPDEGTLADKILKSFEQAETNLLILTKTKNENLFAALGEEDENENPKFYGYNIYLDEVAIVASKNSLRDSFETFVRQVGQRNILFCMSSHRIQADISPVISLNCLWIFWVGPLMDEKEISNLYEKSNIPIRREEFAEKLYHQEKYRWWEKDEKTRKENLSKSVAIIKQA